MATFIPDIVIRTLTYIDNNPQIAQPNLDTNEKISLFLAPIFQSFDRGAQVDDKTLEEGSILVSSKIMPGQMRQIIKTAIRSVNIDQKKRDQNIYQFNLKPNENNTALRLDIFKRPIISTNNRKYQLTLHNQFYLDYEEIHPSIKRLWDNKYFTTSKDWFSLFNQVCTYFDEKAIIRYPSYPLYLKKSFFVHTRIPFIQFGEVVENMLNMFNSKADINQSDSNLRNQSKYDYIVGGCEGVEDENGLNIYSITLYENDKMENEECLYGSLSTLRQKVENIICKNVSIIPKDISNFESINEFLLNVVKEIDPQASLLTSSDGFIIQTQMDYIVLQKVLNTAMQTAYLDNSFPFGYELKLNITKTPSNKDETFTHRVILSQNMKNNLSFDKSINQIKFHLLQNKGLIPKMLNSFETFNPFLTTLLEIVDPSVEIRPVYTLGQMEHAAFVLTKLNKKTVDDILFIISAIYKGKNEYNIESFPFLSDQSNKNLNLALVTVTSKIHSKNTCFQRELESLKKEVTSFITFNPNKIPVHLTHVGLLSHFLEAVLQHIDEKAKIKRPDLEERVENQYDLLTRLHPWVSKRVLQRALKVIYVDDSFLWGYEVEVIPETYDTENEIYKSKLMLKQKFEARELNSIIEKLDLMRHFLIKNEGLTKLPFDNPENILIYLKQVFREMKIDISIDLVEKKPKNKFVFEIKTSEDFPSLSSFISTAFEIFNINQSQTTKASCEHKLEVLKVFPNLKINLLNEWLKKKIYHKESLHQKSSNLYKLEVDAKTTVFANEADFGFELINSIYESPTTSNPENDSYLAAAPNFATIFFT